MTALRCTIRNAGTGLVGEAIILGLCFGIASCPDSAFGQSPPSGAGTPVLLDIYPATLSLDGTDDAQGIVIVAGFADGRTVDVSRAASITIAPDTLAVVSLDAADPASPPKLKPVSDGEGLLTAAFEGRTAVAPVRVKGAGTARAVSFRNDVLPVFMKAGCNTGACHGSAEGKEGFRLSLFGFDPEKDYVAITRDMSARRIDLADPRASLLLRKPLGEVEHGGGQRMTAGGEPEVTLRKWIASRVPDDAADVPRLVGVDVQPRRCVLVGPGATQRLVVRASYSDGSDRDVTSLALYDASDAATVAVSERGSVTAGLKGEAYVMARFGSFAVVTQFIVLPAGEAFEWPETPARNFIDESVFEKLRTLHVAPSPLASDEVFLRRVYLDVLGVLPTVAETRAFLADASAEKRTRLIEALLTRPEFADVWSMKWAEMLRIESSSKRLSFKAMHLYNEWLRGAIRANMPLDRMVRALLTGEGGNFRNPAVNFYLVETSPPQMAENVAQVFLGVRIQCAQCHNHPFERWTQDDYYSFAAFFAQIGRKTTDDPRESVVFNSGGGEVQHLRTGVAMPPRVLGGEIADVKGRDRRAALAEWLTSPQNPYFAACFADRVWAHFMGRGLIDPPDDVRVSNPPSHPRLREQLARQFVETGYDLRDLVRVICNSHTYQASSQALSSNETDRRNFSHAAPRRLPAEVLLDAVCAVTQSAEKFEGLPLGARAVQVADAQSGSYFLSAFGRPQRLSACTCERRDEPTLSQALHLINGATLSAKIADPNGRLARLLSAQTPPETVIEEWYLAALCRMPTETERTALLAACRDAGDPRQALEDIAWAVLNSREFVFNH